MCKTKNQNKKVHQLEEEDYDFDALFVGSIMKNGRSKKKSRADTFSEQLCIYNVDIKFQLDTGARCNVLSACDYRKLNLKGPLQKADVALRSYSGHKIEPEGMIMLPLTWKDQEHLVQFYIVITKLQSVLSGETSENIELIKRLNTIEKDYAGIFEGLGCLPGTYHIKTNPNVKPVVQPARKVPISLKNKIKDELQRMEQMGVIKRK